MKRNLCETIFISVLAIYGLILVINYFLIGFWSSAVLLVLLALGLTAMKTLLQKTNDLPDLWLRTSDRISQNLCVDLIAEDSNGSTVCLVCDDMSCERHDSRLSVGVKPFKGLLVDRTVDDALHEILELTLNHFVNSYLEDIALNAHKLDAELRSILRTLVSALVRRALKVNVTDLLLEELPKVLTQHLETFVWGKRHSRTAQHIEESVLKEYGHLLHPAMNGREDEIKYLTSVVERVLPQVLPPKYLNCQVVDRLFKELLACAVLLPVMDISGDPDKVNALLVVLLDDTELPVHSRRNGTEGMVEILERFTAGKAGDRPANCLGISLKQILSDQQLLFLFQQFSKDEGFINLVQFVLHMNSFSQRLLNPDLTGRQLEELHSETTHIFKSYFLPNSIDYIKFSEDVFNGFQAVVDGKPEDVEKMRNSESFYDAYDYIFNQLETHYCPLFLESDLYFKLICGQRWTSFEGQPPLAKPLQSRSASAESISQNSRLEGVNTGSQDSLDDVFSQLTQDNCEKVSQNGSEDNGWTGFACVDHRMKDLSAWRLSITQVVSRIDPNTGREYDVFLIHVQRLDVQQQQQEEELELSWTVERRYNEFYVLESKLREFHGQNLNEIYLPPKRSFLKPSKPFMEGRRAEFERFLKQLLSNSHLKRSELLYSFLKSTDEFTTGFLPDIRFGKMIRTVPMKFSKERGQHLEPFLLSFISSTEQQKPKPTKNEMSELLEYSPHEFAMANLHRPIYQNMGQWNDSWSSASDSERDVKRIYAQMDYVYDFLLFLLIRFYSINEWLLKTLFTLRPLLRRSLQSLSEWYVKRKLKNSLLVSERIVELIHLLRDSLYFESDLPVRTSAQKKQRSQLTLKYAKEFVPDWVVQNMLGRERHDEFTYLVFSIFQYPLLNKQLLYLIFDIIVKHLFPEVLLPIDNTSRLTSDHS